MTRDPNKLFTDARRDISKNDFETALPKLKKLNALVSGNPDILSSLGFVEASLGLDSGLERAEQAARMAPDNPQVLMHLAFCLEAGGDLKGALETVKKAETLIPGDPAILKQVARLEMTLENFTGALEVLQPLIKNAATDPVVLDRYFSVLVRLGEVNKASAFVEALEGKISEGEFLLHLRARAARAVEDWPRAKKYYKKLAALRPGNASYKRGLSHALIGLEEFAAVIPLLKEIRKQEPANERLIYSMAYALFNDHRHEECLPFVERILAKNPDDVDTLLIKGRSKVFFGELKEAEEIFNRVLELSPGHPLAIMQLTKVKKPKKGDPIFKEMEDMEKTTGDENDYRALIGYTLGEMYEGIGDYDKAFTHFKAGNDRAKTKFAARGFAFDRQVTEETFKRVKSLYTKRVLGALKGRGSSTTVPIFIVAMPRSGTTLLEQIVSSHSRVFGAGELPFGPGLAEKVAEETAGMNEAAFQKHLEDNLSSLARFYLDPLENLETEAEFISDKMPINFMHLGLLQTVFPKAKFIHIDRNPLDVCLSNYKGFFGKGFTYALDLESLGFYYRQYSGLMSHWRETLAQPLYRVSYEALTSDPEGEGKKLMEYLELEWEPECLDFHNRKTKVITMSAIQVREPVHKRSVEKWRRYEKHLSPLLKGLGDDIVKTLEL